MNDILITLISIAALFVFFLVIKEIIPKKYKNSLCAICAAVSLTWISLLILYKLNLFGNIIIIALLMGQTIVGIFYLLEKKIKEDLKLFQLPFLITLTIIVYYLLVPKDTGKGVVFLVFLWGLFILIYLYKSNKSLNRLAKKIVECCKRW